MENPSICGENKCENSYGTYTCVEPTTSTAKATFFEEEKEDNEFSQEDNKSESDEKDLEINNASEEIETSLSGNEIESDKVHIDDNKSSEEEEGEDSAGEKEDFENENSIDDTREEIESDNEIPEDHTPSPPPPSSTIETHLKFPTSTEKSDRESGSESESNESEKNLEESGEEDEDEGDEEEENPSIVETGMHHQSSTVKSDLQNECDDGLRLDDSGKCVGELN